MRLDDPKAEMAAAVAEAAKAGPRTADRTRRFLAIVLDAEQAHRPWAIDELAAIQHAGAGSRFKRHFKPEPVPVPIRAQVEVDVQQISGVVRDGDWQQLPLVEFTVAEIGAKVDKETALRDRTTDELVAYRRLTRFLSKQKAKPDAVVGDVLAAAGVSLDDVLAGAA